MDTARLHDAVVVADMHNDLLEAVVARPPRRWAGFFRERWLPQLRAGGVDIQVLPVFVDDRDRPDATLRQTLRMIEAAHRLAEGNPDDVALCADGQQVDAALASGRIALVLALEGCRAVGTQVELLHTVFRLGVRIASLTHFGRTDLADGSGEDAAGSRLTRAGVEAVLAMQELGMLVDVSHLGAASLQHVLELATRPVVATHSSARALRDHHRNLTDSQIAGIAAGGGLVCVNFFAPFLDPADHSLSRLVDHVEHVAAVAGVDHVGIGPDFTREIHAELTPSWAADGTVEDVDPAACIPGLEGPGGLPLVTRALLDRGFPEGDVAGILGGNALRLLRAELGRSAATPRPSTASASRADHPDPAYWQGRLAQLCRRHRVPGAALGILRTAPGRAEGDQLVEVGHGELSTATGVAVTPDTLFQVGSIGKVWTATLVLQLVDAGVLALDEPVTRYLPDLRLADPTTTSALTLRHLLTHTSGIDGDVFTDTGRGDDARARYAALLAEAQQIHPLGATFSYCNSGLILTGRIVEVVTGRTWEQAVHERLVQPLGLTHVATLPEEALLFRTAVGHVGHDPEPAPRWDAPRYGAPAGSTLACSVGDLLRFARLHLHDGSGPDGQRLLSPGSARMMRDQQIDVPEPYTLGDSWGLGWIRFGWDGRRLVGHDGNSLGQSAFLRLVPDLGVAVALLTNGGHARDLYHELFREVLPRVAGITPPPPPTPPSPPPAVDLRPHLGRYERAGTTTEMLQAGGGFVLRITDTTDDAHLYGDPVTECELVGLDDQLALFRLPGDRAWMGARFYTLDDGTPHLHYGGRTNPRVAP